MTLPHTLSWLEIEFMQKALLGSVILSLTSGFLGLFVVLRRIVFISMSLAEVSSAAVALAFMIGYDPSLVSVVVTFLAVLILALATRRSDRFPVEALIAIVYMLASAAAILLIAKNPRGETDILNVLFGNILTVNARQLEEAFVVAIPTFAALLIFFRSFLFSAFDPEMAMTCGLFSPLWQTLFYLMLGAEIVVGIRMSGALPTFAYLVIPAYAGLRLSRSMGKVVLWSVVIGPISTFVGLWLSFDYDLPTGPTITETLVAAGLVAIAISRVLMLDLPWRSAKARA